jgi:drug/metabolite transporter (DMT)-like permease
MYPDSGVPPGQSPHSGWINASATSRGVALMIASTLAFSAMHTAVRYLSAELPPIQIAFFRNFFGMIIFAPLVLRHGLGFLRTERFPMHLLRAGLNVLAMFAFFTALSLTPLARVNALAFSAPLFAAVLSVVLLGERFHVRRWSAIVVGFIGTMVILRPGIAAVDTGSLLVLLSAGLWGITMIVIRILGRTESSLTTTGYMNLLLSALSLGPALYVWEMPQGIAWFWLLVVGVTGTSAQLALAEALKVAETTVIMPFDFLKIVWAALFGFVLFAEVPGPFTFIGAAIIFTSTLYIAWRERQLSG